MILSYRGNAHVLVHRTVAGSNLSGSFLGMCAGDMVQ